MFVTEAYIIKYFHSQKNIFSTILYLKMFKVILQKRSMHATELILQNSAC